MGVAWLLFRFPRLLGGTGALVIAFLLIASFFMGIISRNPLGYIFALLAIVSFLVMLVLILGRLNVGVA